jgi:hypothetical protein
MDEVEGIHPSPVKNVRRTVWIKYTKIQGNVIKFAVFCRQKKFAIYESDTVPLTVEDA